MQFCKEAPRFILNDVTTSISFIIIQMLKIVGSTLNEKYY